MDFEQIILESLNDYRVVIISAETGAGKSTQVPQFLLKLGLKIVITQPRRLAAISLAKWVSEEMGTTLGDLVGYRTGFEHCDTDKTRCLFVTDGLEIVRELHQTSRPDVLIIDEVHEWNLNIEMLVAWAKKEKIKVILMSATIESKKLLDYYDNSVLINVPGKLFPIVEIEPKHSKPCYEIAELVNQQRNTLVFLSGKSEISKMQEELEELNLTARIMPLHGDLTLDDQKKIFTPSSIPTVILATNIAQTSLTVDYIDAVADLGEEKRMDTIDGIESLVIGRISAADQIQRKGRAGRCKDGIYLDLYAGYDDQLEFSVPEIKRRRLDQLCLRLKINGFDARTIEFFHQPDHDDINEAMRALHSLGAIDKNEEVTALGREISKLPISVHLAAMIVAARKYHVLDDVLTIAACMEVRGILTKDAYLPNLTSQTKSDLLAILDIYARAMTMTAVQMRAAGIHVKSFYKARDLRQKLSEALRDEAKRNRQWVDFKSSGNSQDILKACLSGMIDHVYHCENGRCKNGDDQERDFDDRSVVRPYSAKWIVGLPLNLQVKTKRGGTRLLKLVVMISEITVDMLREIAPHTISVRHEVVGYDSLTNILRFEEVVTINGRETREWVNREADWDELDQYLPPCTDKEELRREAIDAMFLNGMKGYPSLLGPKLLGKDPVYSNNYEPVQYGLDPKTKEPLMAYPAIVKNIVGYYLQHFKTQEEAAKNDKETFSASISRSPFAGLAKLKI